jgi:hypothetical protein
MGRRSVSLLGIALLYSVVPVHGIAAQQVTAVRYTYKSNDMTIVPGQRIGALALGMTARDLYPIMGDPVAQLNTNGAIGMSWGFCMYACPQSAPTGPAIGVYLSNRTGRVYMMSTSDPAFRTAGGIGVGSSELGVRTMLGNPERVRGPYPNGIQYLIYPGATRHGPWMELCVDGSGHIVTVSMMSPGP